MEYEEDYDTSGEAGQIVISDSKILKQVQSLKTFS
jgi:hypothetical protein